MRYLLDTHIYLWWLNGDRKLSYSAKKIIESPEETVFVSVASFWEISVKNRIKKLPLKTSFKKLTENLQFDLIQINLEHIIELDKLPFFHTDPFDRILIAQSKIEDCTLITNDPKIKKYKIPTIG